ncbi:MAG: TIGR00153 family protein [Gammaproteobacteria bacterium]|nr:TIGR00153 family protein [Gammaproteobacteria bacterium]MBQ08781.1 TIGR00153 family protein [Gammaproteobacteria bacterium]MDP6146720.1 TIGR00153 family protein [Gammaproteobacteria bacterium]HJL79976.1 TIGR00153 family protein [Gammaproteobacteria bacterium]|tara:strand:+ start:5509 stop:6186 length:678 start_codon:yes stop_codon:yes gene_type:complete
MNNKSFLGILAESPFTGLQEHMSVGDASVSRLDDFLVAVSQNDWTTAKECREAIIDLENRADDIKNNIRNNLPKSLFMSVSRQDLLDLVMTMDGIPNSAKDISGIMIGRKMKIPSQVNEQFIACSKAAIKAANQACEAVRRVDEMQKSGFGSNDAAALSDLVSNLEQIEKENDELEIALRNQLFECEKEFDPLDMMFFYDIINKIGSLADISQTVGHLLVRLVSR